MFVSLLTQGFSNIKGNYKLPAILSESCVSLLKTNEIITKTQLFKYIENFHIKNWTFSDKNYVFFFVFFFFFFFVFFCCYCCFCCFVLFFVVLLFVCFLLLIFFFFFFFFNIYISAQKQIVVLVRTASPMRF